MNNKGFTLVELLAVITILSIVFVSMVSLNVFKRVDETKALSFVSNAKIIASRAEAMYNTEKYSKDDESLGNKIYLKDITSISNMTDPYGADMDKDESYVLFKTKDEDGVSVDSIYIYLKSCNEKSCYLIGSSDKPLDNSKITYKDEKKKKNN